MIVKELACVIAVAVVGIMTLHPPDAVCIEKWRGLGDSPNPQEWLIGAQPTSNVSARGTPNRVLTVYTDELVSWDEAAEICEAMGSQLLTVDSEDVRLKLKYYYHIYSATWNFDIWIGLHATDKGDYVWHDCHPLGIYAPWLLPMSNGNQNRCVLAHKSKVLTNQFWETLQCSSRLGKAVCEKTEGECNFFTKANTDVSGIHGHILFFITSLEECKKACLTSTYGESTECWGFHLNTHCSLYHAPSQAVFREYFQNTGSTRLYIKNCLQGIESESDLDPYMHSGTSPTYNIPQKGCAAVVTTATYGTSISSSVINTTEGRHVTNASQRTTSHVGATDTTMNTASLQQTTPPPIESTSLRMSSTNAMSSAPSSTGQSPTSTGSDTVHTSPTTESTSSRMSDTNGMVLTFTKDVNKATSYWISSTRMSPKHIAHISTSETKLVNNTDVTTREFHQTTGSVKFQSLKSTRRRFESSPSSKFPLTSLKSGLQTESGTVVIDDIKSTTDPQQGSKTTHSSLNADLSTNQDKWSSAKPTGQTRQSTDSDSAVTFSSFASDSTTAFPSPCMCRCASALHQHNTAEKKAFTDRLLVSLSINKSTISATKRKYQSANDPRPSAQSVGCVGVVLLGLTFGGLMLTDLRILLQDIVKYFKRNC